MAKIKSEVRTLKLNRDNSPSFSTYDRYTLVFMARQVEKVDGKTIAESLYIYGIIGLIYEKFPTEIDSDDGRLRRCGIQA